MAASCGSFCRRLWCGCCVAAHRVAAVQAARLAGSGGGVAAGFREAVASAGLVVCRQGGGGFGGGARCGAAGVGCGGGVKPRGGAGARQEGAGAQVSTHRRRWAGKPVKTRRTCPAVQAYCSVVGLRRAGWCQCVGLENRSLVLRAVPECAGSDRVAYGAAHQ